MALHSFSDTGSPVSMVDPVQQSERDALLRSLPDTASSAAMPLINPFISRLADALLALSEKSSDAKEISTSFNAGNLLRKNGYAFYYLAHANLDRMLSAHTWALCTPNAGTAESKGAVLALVPLEEVEKKVAIDNIALALENHYAEPLAALGARLAHLAGYDDMPVSRNPFRPVVFVTAIHDAWCEFHPDADAHGLLLPLLRPANFLDLGPIFQALNEFLITKGVVPALGDAYRIRKSGADRAGMRKKEINHAAISRQLKNLFNPAPASAPFAAAPPNGIGAPIQEQMLHAAAVSHQLLGYLAGINETVSHARSTAGQPTGIDTAVLSAIKAQAPQGTLSRADESAIDLLTRVFDVVFRDQHIPDEIKQLISSMQVPVLKAALVDKNFFFEEAHPARRLIEVLARSGLDWDKGRGQQDPLYLTIRQSVERVQQGFVEPAGGFSSVLAELETFIQAEETASTEALATPITQALQQEKVGQATKSAKKEVAVRVGTGEVVAFVETFLEKKWITVLTFAYSIQDRKPQAVESALKTMDDLIWSVKPKVTAEQRKELIAKLPPMLAALNQWIDIVKWKDEDRLQFFAELAECHASIVRAPLDISPQRQLEIAVEEARKAAERRLQKRASEAPETVVDMHVETVQELERGDWMEFLQHDSAPRKLRLAWVSPLRTLYIFSTREKKESLSISADELAQRFRDGGVKMIESDGFVGKALAEALDVSGADNPG